MSEKCLTTPPVYFSMGAASTVHAMGPRAKIFLHCGGTGDVAVVRNGCVRVVRGADARLAKGAAGAGHVQRGAGPVARGAVALLGLFGASHVRVRGGVRDAIRLGIDPLVRPVEGAAVARAGVAAVEQVLHRQLDVDTLSLARNLDAVGQGRERAVRPAGAAVLRTRTGRGEESGREREATHKIGTGPALTASAHLRDVLVQRRGAVVHAIVVTPRELIGVKYNTARPSPGDHGKSEWSSCRFNFRRVLQRQGQAWRRSLELEQKS
eukprot:scaffold4851_cov126-Isochrysis_galbana.AAC.5